MENSRWFSGWFIVVWHGVLDWLDWTSTEHQSHGQSYRLEDHPMAFYWMIKRWRFESPNQKPEYVLNMSTSIREIVRLSLYGISIWMSGRSQISNSLVKPLGTCCRLWLQLGPWTLLLLGPPAKKNKGSMQNHRERNAFESPKLETPNSMHVQQIYIDR